MKLLILLLLAQVGLPATRPGPPPPVVTLARVEAAIPALEALITETMASTGLPGMSIAIVYGQQVVYVKGFGVKKAGHPDKVDADTVFQLASLSKPLASTVVATLVRDKTVAWDDPITKHDPTFALKDPWVTAHVTLADLFAHRSGLPDHAGDLLEDLGFERAQILERLRQQPLAPFRASYAYTNYGLTSAALAAARAAGQPWEDLCQDRLYGPLGMTSTSSRFADYVARPNRAVGHVLQNGQWVPKYVRDADAQSPAGGVSSSARDMAQWLKLQLKGAPELEPTRIPQMLTHPEFNFYGLGWNVGADPDGRLKLSHSGAFCLGAGTCVAMLPSEQVAIVALTNGEPHGVAEAMTDAFLEHVVTGRIQRNWVALRHQQFQAALWPPRRYTVLPAHPVPARGGYAGTYANPYYGEARILGDALTLVLGPKGMEFPLRHYDGEVFLYDTVGENASGPSTVTFTPQGMVIEALNETGLGVFSAQPPVR